MRRARGLNERPGAVALLLHQPVLGPYSFELSETTMALCSGCRVSPRDAHDLILGWFYGSRALVAAGWEAGTDQIRAQTPDDRFPLVYARDEPDPQAQLGALLDGIGLSCRHR